MDHTYDERREFLLRLANFRRSRNACPPAYRMGFDVLIAAVERELGALPRAIPHPDETLVGLN